MARRTASNAIDWVAIERQYRLGTKSNTQLATEFGASVSSIGRRATGHGWIADKSEEVAATTNSLLIQIASGNANPNATPSALEIKAAAQTNVDVVLSHRRDIKRSRELMKGLLGELEVTTANRALFEQLGELLDESGPDANGNWKADKRNELYAKVISLSGRVDNSKKVVEMLEKLIKLERQAFGIADEGERKAGYEDLLARIAEQHA